MPANHPSIEAERARDLAERDLDAITKLLESEGWTYLKRRLTDLQQAHRATIADNDDLTGRETRILRALIREYTLILNLPVSDGNAHRATLAAINRPPQGPNRG